MNSENDMSWLDALLIPATPADVAAETAAQEARVQKFMSAKRAMTCPKCNGSGVLHHYRHIVNGQCFKCGGTGQL